MATNKKPTLSQTAVYERQVAKLSADNKSLEHAKKALLKNVEDLQSRLDSMGMLAGAKPPKAIKARKGRGRNVRRQAVPHMLWSDWHIEERVDAKNVNGINVYNPDIARRSIHELVDAYIWLIRDPRFDVRTGIIKVLGDLLSGYIHEELQEHNFMSPVMAALWLIDELKIAFQRLLDETDLERIDVDCVDGNHGRLTHKIRVSTRTQNSIEYLIYKQLANHFANEPRLRFSIAEGEYLYHEVYDFTECDFHGDSVKYQGGIGGLLIPMRRGLNEHRKVRKVDIYNFGHFHQYLDLQDMTGNGSLIGMTPYSLRLKCAPEAPMQAFYMVDSTRGKCMKTPIWLARRAT